MKVKISDLIIILLFIMGLLLSLIFVYINIHVLAVITMIITYILIMIKPSKKKKPFKEDYNRISYLNELLDRKQK